MFEPSSSVFIGTVPWNPDYRHVRLFASRQEQETYMLGKCPNELRRSDYTYQRVDNSIVVPFNAEQLYGYNYCMFKNANYGSKWFYAFIVNTEYVNPESTRLTLATDIMQTWFLDCEVHACYVEREHVNDDSIGAHVKDEGMSTGEMVCTYEDYDESPLYTCVSCAVEPSADGTYVNNGGDVYEGVTCGTALTVFDAVPGQQLGEFRNFMQALADNGQQDAIAAIYMVPGYVLPGLSSKDDGWGAWVKGDNEPARSDEVSYELGFTTLDGYTPKNNKLYCYPFEYGEMTNLTGGNQQFALEFWSNKGTMSFRRTGGVDRSAGMVYVPLGYNGLDVNWEAAVNMPPYPTCSWVYQTYQNEWGQSQVYIDKYNLRYNSLTDPPTAVTGMNMAANMLSAAWNRDVGGLITSAAEGIDSLRTIQEDLQRRQRQPNTERGGTNSSVTLANVGGYKLGIRKWTVRREIAEQIDSFFSMYGYNVSTIKVPNLTGRESWNYVKTQGANIVGKVPAPALRDINALFDRGITFWHHDAVGAYELPNDII